MRDARQRLSHALDVALQGGVGIGTVFPGHRLPGFAAEPDFFRLAQQHQFAASGDRVDRAAGQHGAPQQQQAAGSPAQRRHPHRVTSRQMSAAGDRPAARPPLCNRPPLC